jgi:hypothetical protein
LLDESATQESPLFSRCLKYACADCSYKLKRAGRKMVCGDAPLCPIAPVSISNNALEEMPSHLASQTRMPSTGLPSKIEVLIADLKTLAPDVKWYVPLHAFVTSTHTAHITQYHILHMAPHTRHHRSRPPPSQHPQRAFRRQSTPDPTAACARSIQIRSVGSHHVTYVVVRCSGVSQV